MKNRILLALLGVASLNVGSASDLGLMNPSEARKRFQEASQATASPTPAARTAAVKATVDPAAKLTSSVVLAADKDPNESAALFEQRETYINGLKPLMQPAARNESASANDICEKYEAALRKEQNLMKFVAYYEGWVAFKAKHSASITTKASPDQFTKKYNQAKQILGEMDDQREIMASHALREHQEMSEEAHQGSLAIDQEAAGDAQAMETRQRDAVINDEDAGRRSVMGNEETARAVMMDQGGQMARAAANAHADKMASSSEETAAKHAKIQQLDDLNSIIADLEARAKELTEQGEPSEGLQLDIDGLRRSRDELKAEIEAGVQ